jgi:hypothetical protein
MRSRIATVVVAPVIVATLAWAGATAGSAAAATSPWRRVPTPNVGTLSNGFAAAAALSPSEAWAVGTRQTSSPSPDFRTLAEHFDGTSWSVASTPNGGTLDRLNGVVELAQDDVWAVGNDFDQTAQAYRTLAMRFDGSAWSIVPSPNGGTRFDSLQAVAAVGPSDVWAVGMTQTSGSTIRNLTLVERFDGTSWSIVPSPNPAKETDAWLLGVAAMAADDVWAVGFDQSGTLIEHWDGSVWTIVPTPPTGAGDELTSVAAIGPDDVWAVGDTRAAPAPARMLTEHWDGSAWTVVPSPNQGTQNNQLFGVAGLTSVDVWAVGVRVKPLPEGGFVNRTLTERWDGTAWSVVPSPNLGQDDVLLGATATGPSTVFAVGGFTNPAQRTLVLENDQA